MKQKCPKNDFLFIFMDLLSLLSATLKEQNNNYPIKGEKVQTCT